MQRSFGRKMPPVFPSSLPEFFFMREMWMKKHLEAVDVFTAPSRFMIDHYAKWGIEADRIRHIPNGQSDYSNGLRFRDERQAKNRFGFFGQFVDNKGVHVIPRLWIICALRGFTDFIVELNGTIFAMPAKHGELVLRNFWSEKRNGRTTNKTS